MATGRDDNPKARRFPAEPVRDQDYVTSDELFGEMVDAPMPTGPTPTLAQPARSGPIKVQVTDPRPGAEAARSVGERAASERWSPGWSPCSKPRPVASSARRPG